MIKSDAIMDVGKFGGHGVGGMSGDRGVFGLDGNRDGVQWFQGHLACARDDRWLQWKNGDIFIVIHVNRV